MHVSVDHAGTNPNHCSACKLIRIWTTFDELISTALPAELI